MLTLYIVSTIVAGVLICLSLLGIGHDASEIHADLGHGFDHVDHDGEGWQGALAGWVPFFSLRFFTYFFAAFGSAGLLLHYLTDTPDSLGVWLSAAVGMVSGCSVWFLVRTLRRSEVSSGASDQDVLGKEGQVLVPINGLNPGRIRCTVKGDIIDFLATSEDATPIAAGTSIIVVAMENGRAQVMRRDALFEDDHLVQRT